MASERKTDKYCKIKIITKLLQLQGNNCPICKESLGGCSPVIHHLDSDRTNNEISNLILLHDECHKRLQHPTKRNKKQLSFTTIIEQPKEMSHIDVDMDKKTKLEQKELLKTIGNMLQEMKAIINGTDEKSKIREQIETETWFKIKKKTIEEKMKKGIAGAHDILFNEPDSGLYKETMNKVMSEFDQETRQLWAEADAEADRRIASKNTRCS